MTNLGDSKKLVNAYIGIGSNLGDRRCQIRKSISLVDRCPRTNVIAQSHFYESVPMGTVSQRLYLNCAIKIRTRLGPAELLQQTQRIEKTMGRPKSTLRWGPRRIDLDILIYGDEQIQTETLEIPHPGIINREFVLFPLKDIDPKLNIPGLGILPDIIGSFIGPKPIRIFDQTQTYGIHA